jgi:NADH-quinone oxidoreductase subunit L
MVLVITGIGFLIHLYSADYMADEEGYRRFFAYMNLFVAAMLVLVLADNLLLLYLGWEGVGLCSYLLIGFWYENPHNGRAARKAFIMTRIGDSAFAIGLFLLFDQLGTLDIRDASERAAAHWQPGAPVAIAAASLLLVGAIGKSAQVPLQTWLPDAMAGPTPVSALIHAATMVTAGVYLIARMQPLFSLAPSVQRVVAVVGVVTLLSAALRALVQRDIKRVLAYSTISQIGYMFLALGVGAKTAALFHFLTHACFKALLFLGAGAVSRSLHHELDMFRMGGLRKRLPLLFWTFLVGAASLAGLPLVTAGFYSKDLILWETLTSEQGAWWLWAAGAIGAFLTALYTFRAFFLVFFGAPRTQPLSDGSPTMAVPLVLLALLSLFTGFLQLPRTLGDWPWFGRFLGAPSAHAAADWSLADEALHQLLLATLSLGGVGVAWLFYRRAGWDLVEQRSRGEAALQPGRWEAWSLDRLYDRWIVGPYVKAAQANRADVVNGFYDAAAEAVVRVHLRLSGLQTGAVRWYAAVFVGSAALFIWFMIT